jgi:hypothetical protein
MSAQPSADRIEQVAFGFMASKVLFSAIEFGLFTELAKGPLSAAEIQKRCGLHPRSIRDFLDALVALGMLERSADIYSNTSETNFYLDRTKSTYMGNLFEMFRCWRGSRQLPPALRRARSSTANHSSCSGCDAPSPSCRSAPGRRPCSIENRS